MEQDGERDRLSIPTSSSTEAEDIRNQRYTREANNQDLSDADDSARDRDVGMSGRRGPTEE